jgi:quercetin dioxygenase-like cupin family protein
MTTNPPFPPALRLENRHTGEVLEIRRQKRNGEIVFGLRGTLPARREGPPLHIHHLEDEEGLITGGTLSAEVDGQRLTVGPGQTVRLPRGPAPMVEWRGSATGLRGLHAPGC